MSGKVFALGLASFVWGYLQGLADGKARGYMEGCRETLLDVVRGMTR